MKKIAVLGGTGMTGQCVVKSALEKGLEVKVLYRNENFIPDFFKDKVELVKGDATNYEDILNFLKGTDAVIVVLGTRNKLDPTTELSTGTANVVKAMSELKIARVSICLSSFLFWDQEKVPKQFGNINDEHKKMLEIVKASDLEFIAVLPPHIADEPAGEITILHDSSPGRVVSKWNLAQFLIECLDQAEHVRKVCGLAKKSQ